MLLLLQEIMRIQFKMFIVGCFVLGVTSCDYPESKQQMIASQNTATNNGVFTASPKTSFWMDWYNGEIYLRNGADGQRYNIEQLRQWLRVNKSDDVVTFYLGKQFNADRELIKKVVPELKNVLGEFERRGKYWVIGNGLGERASISKIRGAELAGKEGLAQRDYPGKTNRYVCQPRRG